MIFKKEHELLRKTVRDFVEREMATYPDEVDEIGSLPKEVIAKLVKHKFISTIIPKEFGGAGADYVSYAIVMEEISRRCASTGTYITAASSLVALPLVNFGTKEQKEKYLRPLAEGKYIGCFGLTEPGAGSDAGAGQTIAVD